jgi:hypothetical protein
VAEAAVCAHVLGSVTVHAAIHADVAFASHLLALGDWTVTIFALAAGREVRAMAEPNPRGRVVDANPGDLLATLGGGSEFLNRRLIRGDGRVAGHAGRYRGETHGVTGIGVDVTSVALQLESAGVELVTVRKRLFRRWLRRGQGREDQGYRPQLRGKAKRGTERPHRTSHSLSVQPVHLLHFFRQVLGAA